MRVRIGWPAIVMVVAVTIVPGAAYGAGPAVHPSAKPPVVPGQFTAAACQAQACTLVGDYVNADGVEVPLAEHRTGTKWNLQTTPDPAGALSSTLWGVSCAAGSRKSGGRCEAVGDSTDSSGLRAAMAEGRSKRTWTMQTVQVPSGTESSTLSGVSCASAFFCMAVGSYVNSAGVQEILAEQWAGPTWVLETPPDPAGAKSSSLSGVSCVPTPLACIAVGSYTTGSGVQKTFVEQWLSSGWSTETIPNPSGATSSSLLGVSCVTDTCTGVGESSTDGTTTTLAEQGTGTSWGIQTTPNPAGASSRLDAVSCDPSYACTAVGAGQDPTEDQAFAEAWDGTSWTIETTSNPVGAVQDDLFGVSCTATNTCTAAGDYIDGEGDRLPLAEVWDGMSWTVQKTAKLP